MLLSDILQKIFTMKKLLLLATISLSFNAVAFGLPKLEVPKASSAGNLTENIATALKALHDGGIQCDKITNFEPTLSMKGELTGAEVQCDEKNTYTVLKNDAGMVIKS